MRGIPPPPAAPAAAQRAKEGSGRAFRPAQPPAPGRRLFLYRDEEILGILKDD